ncbi:ABC transporter permease [Paludibaculum fermentans]|uniref:ABC transporter permease n=1 Tax=Paludibaculum fermentans TaxID=1473598 RepID=A0A7S7SJS4_PALFE|nr:ABC transporter permease [Paludibaculum fermentans]QOY86736.1 ABC transporter permease [Paludibaculum fermentans]
MSWLTRFRNALRPEPLETELEDEFQEHLEQRAKRLETKGLSPEEARREAALRFGNSTLIRERSRDIRLWLGLETGLQDLRYGWRALRRNPVFAITAILSLSLAIGANTAIYSVVDAAILRKLPVPDPDSLIYLATPPIQQPGSETSDENTSFNYPVFNSFREAAGDSARLAGVGFPGRAEISDSAPGAPIEKVTRAYVSGEFFQVFGVTPALGRLFTAAEDKVPGGHPVMVLSYDFWQRRFHGDPGVINRTLLHDKTLYTIVGVAREGFFGNEPSRFVDIWVPTMMYQKEAFTNDRWQWMRITGRLGPGTTREQLAARFQPVLSQSNENRLKRMTTVPDVVRKQILEMKIFVQSGARGVSTFRRTFARPLWVVLCVAAAILLIACANVASLLLARASARAAEMAMRISLGAARLRLVRQLLTESLMLAGLAGVAGWLIARLAAPAVVAMLATPGDPYRFALEMDSRVLLFCALISALATLLFGMLPAWQASGTQPMQVLRGAASHGGRLRLGRLFVSVQVAFAFCLVMAGACFLFSLRNLRAVDAGFDPHQLALFSISNEVPAQEKAPKSNLMIQMRDRMAALSGVQAAAVAPWVVLEGSTWTDQIFLPGKSPSDREEIFYPVSSGYINTMRMRMLAGRDFTPREANNDPVVATVVNMAFVRRYFNSEDPEAALDKSFQRSSQPSMVTHRIVGVVSDSHYSSLRKAPVPIVYMPAEGSSYYTLHVRSNLDLPSLTRLVEREAAAVGSGTRLREVTTLDTLVGNTLLRERLLAVIGGTFALLGLVLAAIGLFGLLNYSVARRTREIGIRSALGAQRGEIVMLVGKDLAGMVGGGLLTGLVASLGLMTLVRSLLFGIRTVDPLVIGSATAVFSLVALMAGAFPAGRAAAVDPVVALRGE